MALSDGIHLVITWVRVPMPFMRFAGRKHCYSNRQKSAKVEFRSPISKALHVMLPMPHSVESSSTNRSDTLAMVLSPQRPREILTLCSDKVTKYCAMAAALLPPGKSPATRSDIGRKPNGGPAAMVVTRYDGGEDCYYMAKLDILSAEFTLRAENAWDRARDEALARGIPVFYRDHRTGIEIMQQPDGRRFEIRFIAGAPRGCNYEIVRELSASAA